MALRGNVRSRLVRYAATAAFTALGFATIGSTTAGAVTPTRDSHAYRHGAVWARDSAAAQRAVVRATAAGNLRYGGGVSGVGVTTGPPKVYVVFWGSQWGSQTSGSGYLSLSGDPNGMAPDLQAFLDGLGRAGELWSGVMTQYCEGVAAGSQTCAASAAHVGYPTGGALAGVWADGSAAAPQQANAHQIGQEAVNAAGHFGNTTSASNRSVQYFIVSPTGTTPDGFNTPGGNFCAWHDYTGDSTMSGGPVSSPYGPLAFTNMPYVTDAGASCGQNFVNGGSAGTLDGVTIVGGHEYAETITDQFPAGGWTDIGGAENGDKCAWISGGQGASQNITLSTGTFAVQSTWSNDFNGGAGGCQVSHPVVGGTTSNDFSIAASPAARTVTAGSGTTYTVTTAVTSGSATSVNLSANGLPAGATASFNPTSVNAGASSTLTVSTASATAAGTYSVTVSGSNGTSSHSTSVSLTVNGSGGGGGGGIVNGGFETGTLSGWTVSGASAAISTVAHSGTYSAVLGLTTPTNGDSSIAQTFTSPSAGGTLSFWYQMSCPDTLTYDWATATVKDNTSGSSSTLLGKTCATTGGWVQVSGQLGSMAGHSVTITLTSHDDNYSTDPTYTRFDDVAISAPVVSPLVNGGFETGILAGWSPSGASARAGSPGHTGSYSAVLGSNSPTGGDSSIAQTFTVPSTGGTLSFWYQVHCPDTVTYDWATATLRDNTSGTTTTLLGRTCTNSGAWVQVRYSLGSRGGHSVTLTLTSRDDNYPGDPTYTLFDDVTVG